MVARRTVRHLVAKPADPLGRAPPQGTIEPLAAVCLKPLNPNPLYVSRTSLMFETYSGSLILPKIPMSLPKIPISQTQNPNPLHVSRIPLILETYRGSLMFAQDTNVFAKEAHC